MRALLALLLLAALPLTACDHEPDALAEPTPDAGMADTGMPGPGPGPGFDDDRPPPFEVPASPQLLWKRGEVFVNDLARALDLSREQLCNELDVVPCADVHRISLGGHDAVELGVFAPMDDPLATTPAVVDRMVIGACANAVERDRQASPVIFTQIDLDAPTERESDGAAALVTDLYRRFHGRDPLMEELVITLELALDDAGEPVEGGLFATLACYAVGTTTEFVFY